MYAKKDFICNLMFLVILVLCDGGVTKTKFKRHVKSRNSKVLNSFSPEFKNTTIENSNRSGKGFFFNSGIFTLGKVLNFFPVGGEKECQPTGYNVAKAGICLNAYDCRQRDGRAAGDCAHGLGACCVFEVSCGGVVQNNITYFMSPGFPELWNGDEDCNITIDKTHAGIMQLRIDLIHFTLGQPNRRTGECDEDAMILGDGETNLTLCGQNHGQHVYYTLSSKSESREDEDLQGSVTTTLSMRMRGGDMPRLWLMRLAQMPLAHSAPHECLQYYTSDNGTIKTFNFAINGRHLAGMEYQSCIRRNAGFCSIRYMPCDDRSFRIGPSGNMTTFDPAQYGITTLMNTISPPSTSATSSDPISLDTQNVTNADEMMPVSDEETQDDDMEGSGADPGIEAEGPGMMSRIWTYMTTWNFWDQGRSFRWSPYIKYYNEEDDNLRYTGYGTYGEGLLGYGRQRCQDRITIPCENEYFVSSQSTGPGVCDPHHCGNNFCPGKSFHQCRVETSITPFAVSMHFGPPIPKRSPEDNIGVCLRYYQLPCDT